MFQRPIAKIHFLISQRIEVFSFIKGKINTEGKKTIDDLEEDLHLKIKESLNINNGYISEAISENDQDINIGRIKYDTGSYLIIGTPVIFVTY